MVRVSLPGQTSHSYTPGFLGSEIGSALRRSKNSLSADLSCVTVCISALQQKNTLPGICSTWHI